MPQSHNVPDGVTAYNFDICCSDNLCIVLAFIYSVSSAVYLSKATGVAVADLGEGVWGVRPLPSCSGGGLGCATPLQVFLDSSYVSHDFDSTS